MARRTLLLLENGGQHWRMVWGNIVVELWRVCANEDDCCVVTGALLTTKDAGDCRGTEGGGRGTLDAGGSTKDGGCCPDAHCCHCRLRILERIKCLRMRAVELLAAFAIAST